MASETRIGGHLNSKGGIFELQKENCRFLPKGDHSKACQDQPSDQLGLCLKVIRSNINLIKIEGKEQIYTVCCPRLPSDEEARIGVRRHKRDPNKEEKIFGYDENGWPFGPCTCTLKPNGYDQEDGSLCFACFKQCEKCPALREKMPFCRYYEENKVGARLTYENQRASPTPLGDSPGH